MKPVDQTILHNDTQRGDCFRACVASLLECDVPHFCEHDDWWKRFTNWLQEQGLFAIEVPVKTSVSLSPMWCILSGKSPRGIMHSIVGRYDGDGHYIYEHDPHPDRRFFSEEPEWVMFIGRTV